MASDISQFISFLNFSVAFKSLDRKRYDQFVLFSQPRLLKKLDVETQITSFNIHNSHNGSVGNRHVNFNGLASRRNERGEIGGTIVWLQNYQSFRGDFWCQLKPRSNNEIFTDAKKLFFGKQYRRFLSIAKFIGPHFEDNEIFNKMIQKSISIVGDNTNDYHKN